jgi:demethylmenaquinone methyltransferase/2-methoxy-6-polyprenyl-1,4-benzoquinol methylase
MTGANETDVTHRLLESQQRFYDLRAPDYGDETKPPDRKLHGNMPPEMARGIIDNLQPTGDVLELACGPGTFTRELVRYARCITGVDSSVRMLERNRAAIDDPRVSYVQADVFGWTPDRLYDLVFFGFWLSHVPPTAFDRFWSLVAECLRPGGRVAFVDEDDRGLGVTDEPHAVDGIPAARRSLLDGREFDIVKVFWEPDQLHARLRALNWGVEIRRIGATFMWGVGCPCSAA